jgi:predicted O-linked N-acetylglucosamine transferase (SPINDLY family)
MKRLREGGAAAAVPSWTRLGPEAAHALIGGAMRLADTGKLAEAEDAFRQALVIDPTLADGYYGLGLLALSVQQYDMARGMLEHALKLAPRAAAYHNAMGRLHKAQGRLEDAERCYLRALELNPGLNAARVSLGLLYREAKRLHDAVECHREALVRDPRFLEAHVNLVNALRNIGDLALAKDVYESLIARHPGVAELHYFHATLLREADREDAAREQFEIAARLDRDLREAADGDPELPPDRRRLAQVIAFHRRIVERRPSSPEAHRNLGMALRDFGALMEALEPLGRAVDLKPDYAEAYTGLGQVLLELRGLDQSAEAMRKALELKPDHIPALSGLATALLELGRASEAEQHSLHAVEVDAQNAESQLIHANVLLNRRRHEDAYAHYRESIRLAGEHSLGAALNNLLFTLNYSDRMGGAALLEEHRRIGATCAQPGEPPVFERDADPRRKLRLAYVSPDFRGHAVAVFIEPVIAGHDRGAFELFLYSTHAGRPDPTTERFRAAADRWTDCGRLSDDDLVARIREDRVDVLVDLAGHTGGSRLFALARRAAPVQLTMLGYPTTSGMPNIDYRVTDWHVDPEGWDARNTETPLRLPHSYYCYRAPITLPLVAPPALANGYVTFGSLNNLSKVSDAALALWADVLAAVPDSRLVLKHRGFGDPGTQADLVAYFAGRGIDGERVRIVGWEERGDTHLEWYNRMDVALDTYPYNGATTTCEALWMGVPVVTLAGDTHASRMGLSILSAAGLADFVAETPTGYVERAVAAARDLDALAGLRATLRERLAASPLCDVPGYTAALESLYREAWRRWCAVPPGGGVA